MSHCANPIFSNFLIVSSFMYKIRGEHMKRCKLCGHVVSNLSIEGICDKCIQKKQADHRKIMELLDDSDYDGDPYFARNIDHLFEKNNNDYYIHTNTTIESTKMQKVKKDRLDYVAIDFETANKYRGSACSLGLVVVENSAIVEERQWLIKPIPCKFDDFNSSLTGLCLDDVVNQPSFIELWSEIKQYFDNIGTVAAHNASFDISVLKYLCNDLKLPLPNINILCSYNLAKSAMPNLSTYRLDYLCKKLNICLDHHNAISDAKGCANLINQIANEKNIHNYSDMEMILGIKLGIWNEQDYVPCRSNIKQKYQKSEYCSIKATASNYKNICPTYFDNDFVGKYFVFTGALKSMPRSKAMEIVAKAGGIPQDSVTKKTNYLVTGIQDIKKVGLNGISRKFKRAQDLKIAGQDIEIIGEDDFINFIDPELWKMC